MQAARKGKKSYRSHLKFIEKSIPANRFASPDEIASLVAFLVSEEAGYVNGVNLNIDGSLLKVIKLFLFKKDYFTDPKVRWKKINNKIFTKFIREKILKKVKLKTLKFIKI